MVYVAQKLIFFYQISTEIFRWQNFFWWRLFLQSICSHKKSPFQQIWNFAQIFFALVSTKNEWMVFNETIFGLYAVPIKHMCHV